MISLCLQSKYLNPKLTSHTGKIAVISTIIAVVAVLFASLSYYSVGIFSSPTIGYATGSIGVLSIFDALRFGLLHKKQKSLFTTPPFPMSTPMSVSTKLMTTPTLHLPPIPASLLPTSTPALIPTSAPAPPMPISPFPISTSPSPASTFEPLSASPISKSIPSKIFALTRLKQPEFPGNDIEPYFVWKTLTKHCPLRINTFSSPSGNKISIVFRGLKSTKEPTPPKVFAPLTRLKQPEISESEIEPYFVRPTSAEEHFPLRLHTFSSPSGDKISIAFRKKRSIIGGSLDEWTFLRYPLGETPDLALVLGQILPTKEQKKLRLNDPRVKTETAYSLAHAASRNVQTVIYEIQAAMMGPIGRYNDGNRRLVAYITEVYKDKKIERLLLCNNALFVISPLTHEQVASKVISYITEHSLPTPKVFYTLDPGVVLVACPKLSNGYNFRVWHYLQNGNIKNAKESTSGGQSFTRCRNLECYSLDLDKDIEDPSIQTVSIDGKQGHLLNPTDLRKRLLRDIDNHLSRVPIPIVLNQIIVRYLL